MKRLFFLALLFGVPASAQTIQQGQPVVTTTQLAAGLSSAPTVTSGGASYVNNDTITLDAGCTGTVNGVVQSNPVLTVTNASGGVIQAAGVSVTSAGVCVTPPAPPVAQLSSSGSGTGATFTPGATTWTGTYTITSASFSVRLQGPGGGGGGVSNVNAAGASPGGAGQMVGILYTGQTLGGTITYRLGVQGVGGAAGAVVAPSS